jgi:hypothetical protein
METILEHAWQWYTIALMLLLSGMCLITRDVEYIHSHPGEIVMETAVFSIIAAIVVGGVSFLHGYTKTAYYILYAVGIVILLHFMLQLSGIYSMWSYTQPTKENLTLHDRMVEGIAFSTIFFGVLPLFLYVVFLTYKNQKTGIVKYIDLVKDDWKLVIFLLEICIVAVASSYPFMIVVHDRVGQIPSHATLSLSLLMLFVGSVYTLLYVGGAFLEKK